MNRLVDLERAARAMGILLVLVTGCAQAPKGRDIAPTSLTAESRHEDAVEVHVRGGGKDWRLSAEALHEAIVTGIQQSRVFADISSDGSARYRLDVVIGSVRQPPVGWNFTVDVQTIWNLSIAETGETVWQETITGTDTATPGDAVAADQPFADRNRASSRAVRGGRAAKDRDPDL